MIDDNANVDLLKENFFKKIATLLETQTQSKLTMLNKQEYDALIDEVKEAQLAFRKTTKQKRRIERFDVLFHSLSYSLYEINFFLLHILYFILYII